MKRWGKKVTFVLENFTFELYLDKQFWTHSKASSTKYIFKIRYKTPHQWRLCDEYFVHIS